MGIDRLAEGSDLLEADDGASDGAAAGGGRFVGLSPLSNLSCLSDLSVRSVRSVLSVRSLSSDILEVAEETTEGDEVDGGGGAGGRPLGHMAVFSPTLEYA